MLKAGDGTQVAGRLDVALIDVAWSVPLDADGDGRLTWNEIEARRGPIAAFLGGGLRFTRGGQALCRTASASPGSPNGLACLICHSTSMPSARRRGRSRSPIPFSSTAMPTTASSSPWRRASAVHATTLAPGIRAWTRACTGLRVADGARVPAPGHVPRVDGLRPPRVPGAAAVAGRGPARVARERARDRARPRAHRHRVHGGALDHARARRDGRDPPAAATDRSRDCGVARRRGGS